MTERRRTFGPIVAVGVAAAVLASVAGMRPWVHVVDADSAIALASVGAEDGEMALAGAVSLVLLAAWGVVLVTRGLVRRSAAGLGLLAALGLGIIAWAGYRGLRRSLLDQVREAGADVATTGLTGWFWVSLVATAVSIGATAAAVAWCPQWPEMGSRYDAPGATRDDVPAEEQSTLDLWKSMDEGRDPTA